MEEPIHDIILFYYSAVLFEYKLLHETWFLDSQKDLINTSIEKKKG